MNYPLTLPIRALHPDVRKNLPQKIEYIDVYPKGYNNKRSNQQNKLYWSWLRIISKETGHEDYELHEFFKNKFLDCEIKEVIGVKTKLYPSTTKLNKRDFTNFLNSVEMFAWHELKIALPHPNE